MLLFNSFFYLIFLFIAISGYFLTPKKHRWITLLIFSLIFYATFSYKFLFFLFATITTIYLGARYFDKVNTAQKEFLETEGAQLDIEAKKQLKRKNKRKKKAVFILVLLFNVGVLFALKYLNFVGGIVNDMIGWFSGKPVVPRFSLILPLGISFYTFQALGYLIDCYWGKIQPQKNFFKFALFLSFFPQLVQGPISRYDQIGEALIGGGDFNPKNIVRGGQLIIWGLFKKMVVADLFAYAVTSIFGQWQTASSLVVILGALFYFFQDYADFSGCIDIARGSAECLGINLPQNFERPYFAFSIAEYWRRWHITLGTWFKDYIFYPISVSKFSMKLGKVSKKIFGAFGKNIPAIVGLLVTWLTTGIWHGASWNYVVWGLYFGILIVSQIIFQPLVDKVVAKLKINTKNGFVRAFAWFRTLILLLIGRTIFRGESLQASFTMIGKGFCIFTYDFSRLVQDFTTFSINQLTLIAFIGMAIVLIVDLIKELHPNISLRDKISSAPIVVSWSVFLLLIAVIVIFGAYGVTTSVADFIYMQF